ncbi:MAG: biotin synthase, partial [Bacteroidota bacterium]|nr:biotin synthase [Bacteroidota bacterium]
MRNNWTKEEVNEIYELPLLELVYRAATVHRSFNNTAEVQVCTLLSVKTGGCSE